MKQLLERIRLSPVSDLSARWRQNLGEDLFHALVEIRVLQRGPLADWYPCPGVGDSCPRRVVENPLDPDRPFIALPGEDFCCEPLYLRREDLGTHQLSLSQFVRLVREVVAIEGPMRLDHPLMEGLISIGRQDTETGWREVLLSTDPSASGFGQLLWFRLAKGLRTLVLATCRDRWFDGALETQFCDGDVEVAFLEDLLAFRGGRFVWGREHSDRSTTSLEPSMSFCVLVDDRGSRPIGPEEYRSVRERSSEYDLFIDTMTNAKAGGAESSKRTPDGEVIEGRLTSSQANSLIELIECRKPRVAGRLSALRDSHNPVKILEAARRQVDYSPSRRKWRSIQLIQTSDRRYVFNPPEGLRFAVLRPLET